MFQWEWYEKRRLKLLAAESIGTSILDIGYASLPNPYLPALNVTGIDIQPPAPNVPYARTFTADVQEISRVLRGNEFDTIIAGELIEHLRDPIGFLSEVQHLLSPGGRLVLSTPNPIAFPTLFAEWWQSTRYFYTADHLFYFTPRWVKRLLEHTGYSLVRIRPVGLWVPWVPIPVSPVTMSYQIVYVAIRSS